jgi:cytoskeletal protein CcmA (bactofilin family)
MTHLTALQLSMHADDALRHRLDDLAAAHLAGCDECQARLAALRKERLVIVDALRMESGTDHSRAPIPPFRPPTTLRGFAFANLTAGLVIWLGQFLWKTLFGELVVDAASWFASVYVPDAYELGSTVLLKILEEGTVMFDAYLALIVAIALVLGALSLLLKYRRSRAMLGSCLFVLMVPLLMPLPASALEVRRNETGVVTIGAAETIDDTLVVAADRVVIEGTVTGDVIAAGRSIEVSGTVGGNLLAFGESVRVRGKVGGSTVAAARDVRLDGAAIDGDLWAAGGGVVIDPRARVGRNATLASETATIEGVIARDLYAFSETIELRGSLGQDFEAFAGRVRLLGDARIGGNLRFRSGSEDRLDQDATARVEGEIEFLGQPQGFERRSRYATIEFYLWQAAWLVGAFLVGLALLWLVPDLRTVSLRAGAEGFKTAGIGLVTLVSVPVLAVLAALSLVGLPLGLIAFVAWMIGLYLAKIVVAALVGRMLLIDREGFAVPLLTGLAIVTVAVNLPFVGGIVSVLLTVVGLGLIAQYAIANLPATRFEATRASLP